VSEENIEGVRAFLEHRGIEAHYDWQIGQRGWLITHDEGKLGSHGINLQPTNEDDPSPEIEGRADWRPRPGPVDPDILYEEALMRALKRLIEHQEQSPEDA